MSHNYKGLDQFLIRSDPIKFALAISPSVARLHCLPPACSSAHLKLSGCKAFTYDLCGTFYKAQFLGWSACSFPLVSLLHFQSKSVHTVTILRIASHMLLLFLSGLLFGVQISQLYNNDGVCITLYSFNSVSLHRPVIYLMFAYSTTTELDPS
jgi:hypothetical protein